MTDATMEERESKRIAYHEAGHAVMCYRQHVAFRHVTIVPEGDVSLGHVATTGYPASFQPDINEDAKTRDRVEREVMIFFAGAAAEEIAGLYDPELAGEWADNHALIDLASYVSSETEELEAYLAWLRLRTRNILSAAYLWSAVEGLVTALLAEKTIKVRRARAIIRASIAAYVQDEQHRAKIDASLASYFQKEAERERAAFEDASAALKANALA